MATKQDAIFFFAHQDDEFGVYNEIHQALRQGRRVICIYFTSGEIAHPKYQNRDEESLFVLSQLGVDSKNINFVGTELGIPDGRLAYNLEPIINWMDGFFEDLDSSVSLYIPAWEGGHHDHDALHAAVVICANRRGLLSACWQYPLYHSYRCPFNFFRVLSPLALNGLTIKSKIRWKERIKYLKYCLSYPSQIKTWMGLFPFVLLNYMFRGYQSLQRPSYGRIFERPHPGMLFYERRGRFAWVELNELIIKARSNLGAS